MAKHSTSPRRGLRPARGSWLRRVLVVALSFLIASVGLVQPAAAVGPVVRPSDPDQGLWQFTGRAAPSNAGVHTNRKQNIVAWCTGDSQPGPYSTYPLGSKHQGNFKYKTQLRINAGSAYKPGDTARGYKKGSDGWTGPDIKASETGIPAQHTGKVAYILYKYGRDMSLRNDPNRASGIHWALHDHTHATSAKLHHGGITSSARNLASDIKDEAARYAGPYTGGGGISAAESTPYGGGTIGPHVGGIAVRSESGRRVGGVSFTVSLDGPATFTNGSKVRTGTTSSSSSLAFEIKPEGAGGVVRATVVYTGLPSTHFYVLADANAQDLWIAGSSEKLSVTTTSATLAGKFTPAISTQADPVYIDKGDPFTSQVTAGPRKNHTWPKVGGKDVAVKADGVVYGPFDTPQAAADTPPSGAPVAAQTTATFNGPGTITRTTATTASKPGYYTWVWTVNHKDPANSKYVDQTVTTRFFAPNSTQVVRTPLNIDVNVNQKWVKQGDNVRSTVTVTPDGGTWPRTTSGKAAEFALTGALYGPYDRPQTLGSTPSQSKAVATTKVYVADTKARQSPNVKLPNNGYYAWVWTIDPDQQTGEAKTLLPNGTTSTFFDPKSYHIGRMEVRLDTKADPNQIRPGERFGAEVTARLAEPDDLWLYDESGKKVQVRADGTLYGHYGQMPNAQPTAPAGAPVAGASRTTFTAPGTKKVTGDASGKPIIADEDGAYSWVWRADPGQQAGSNGNYFIGHQSPFFAPASITHVRGPVTMTAVAHDDSGDLVGQAGENVDVHFTVVNTSNTRVCEFRIDTAKLGTLDASHALGDFDGCLDPGEMVVVAASYTVTDQDVESGDPLTFAGQITGHNVYDVPFLPAAAEAVLVVDNSARGDETTALQLTQSFEIVPSPTSPENRSVQVALEGDDVIYTFRVKNAGHETLTATTLQTAAPLPADLDDWDGLLEPGQTVTIYSKPVKVTASHVQAGKIVNEAVANAKDLAGQPVVSNWTVTKVPTSATPVIIETGEGAGQSRQTMLWLAAGAGLLLVAGGLMLAAWDRGRRRG